MSKIKKSVLIIICISLLVALDLITKNIAQAELRGQQSITLLGGFVKLIYAENTGGMLSFGSTIPEFLKVIIFQVFVSILLLFLFGYIIYKNDLTKIQITAFLLFLGGGFGNLIDRIFNEGKVVDFILLQAGGLHTGIFNAADMYVTTGVGLILAAAIMDKFSENKKVKKISNAERKPENSND